MKGWNVILHTLNIRDDLYLYCNVLLQYIIFMNVFRFAMKSCAFMRRKKKIYYIILTNNIYLIRRIENFFIPILKMSLNFNVNLKFILIYILSEQKL